MPEFNENGKKPTEKNLVLSTPSDDIENGKYT